VFLVKVSVTVSEAFDVLPAERVATPLSQWEFQDPKMEVLYHIRPYFGGIFPYIGLT